jgi:hypothetical protein
VCDAFQRNLIRTEDLPGGTPFVTTFWPLRVPSTDPSTVPSAGTSDLDCDWLIDHYDYAKGSRAAAEAGMLASSGPMLVATTNPRRHAGGRTYTLDLTTTDLARLDSAFGIWRSRIVQQPESWDDGDRWKQLANDTITTFNQIGAAFGFRDLKSIWSVFGG